jgi:NAD dependent epimerase/dehydratase family enzyme
VTNATFTRTLAHVLRRPAILPVPALLLRFLFGELAEATLLAGQRALPTRLEAAAFPFAYPALEAALLHILPRD